MEYILDEKGYIGKFPIKYIIIDNNCWQCTSHNKKEDGYIFIGRNKKQQYIHRYIYSIYYGEIQKGLVIRHKCDNRACINPEHLESGTQQDNLNDMKIRGRSNKGKKIKKHSEESKTKKSIKKMKLNETQLLEIKKLLIDGNLFQKEIADKFGVSVTNISNIKTGNSVYSKFLGGGLKEWLYE
jgi:predicted XRE-type DNA-binding protein